MNGDFQSGLEDTPMAHHTVFSRFPCWQGEVPAGFSVNFLGVVTRKSYWRPPNVRVLTGDSASRFVKTEYPAQDEEYFEWIDVLESVVAAEGHFAMLELGAGWGPWTVNAAVALRRIGSLPCTFVAVEAEPTHFRWMRQHLSDNAFNVENFQLLQAAVAGTDGKVPFRIVDAEQGGPAEWYGQWIDRRNRDGGATWVDAVSLNTLLQSLATVDLVDLDIQGAELEVLEAAARELDRKVKRVHIGTHGQRIEEGLRSLFARLGWRCLRCFPSGARIDTEWGTISFQDGVQTWLNPAYCDRLASESAILMEKLERSRQEGARLWAELEKRSTNSLASRIVERSRKLRDRLAPAGTGRRAALDLIARKKT